MRALVVALILVGACSSGSAPTPFVAPASTVPVPSPSGSLSTPQSTSAPVTPLPSAVAAVGQIQELRSETLRNAPGPDRLAGVATLSTADADLGFRLYHELTNGSDENLFFSPYSISTALSMTLAGARGNTAEEIAAVLGVGADQQAWHDARNRLELALSSLESRHLPSEGEAEPLTLEPTNAIFGQADYAFRDAYLDLLAADYGAGMQAVDFIGNPEAARLGINAWVADRTRDRIEELLKEGSITPLARAVLVNAIYFKGNWYHEFAGDRTSAEPFHPLEGPAWDVQTMHASPETGYASGRGWAAVQLRYWGDASMIVVVPDEGRFSDIESRVDSEFVDELRAALTTHEVHLSLPRWESESTLSLSRVLEELGIHDAFDEDRADLSGMADFSRTGESLFVADVIHQANITVDEEGTEAAAATAVLVFAVCKCPPPEVTLTIDRPFIYLIRDDITGEILFLGRVLNPKLL